MNNFMEASSGIGRVGRSRGVTAVDNIPSEMMWIARMYLGQGGQVSFALALAMRPIRQRNIVLPEGRIIVG